MAELQLALQIALGHDIGRDVEQPAVAVPAFDRHQVEGPLLGEHVRAHQDPYHRVVSLQVQAAGQHAPDPERADPVPDLGPPHVVLDVTDAVGGGAEGSVVTLAYCAPRTEATPGPSSGRPPPAGATSQVPNISPRAPRRRKCYGSQRGPGRWGRTRSDRAAFPQRKDLS